MAEETFKKNKFKDGRILYGPSDFIYDHEYHPRVHPQQRFHENVCDAQSVFSEPTGIRSAYTCRDINDTHFMQPQVVSASGAPLTTIRRYKTTKTTTTTQPAQQFSTQQQLHRNSRSSSIPAVPRATQSTTRNYRSSAQHSTMDSRAASTPRTLDERSYRSTLNTQQKQQTNQQRSSSYKENVNGHAYQGDQSSRTIPVNYNSYQNTSLTRNSPSCILHSNYNSDWTMRHPHLDPYHNRQQFYTHNDINKQPINVEIY
jgi:hypothetical protein